MGAKGGRPRKIEGEKTAIHLVLPDRLIAGYDRWLERVQLTVPGGLGITRADLMRDVLEKGLRAQEAEDQAARPTASAPPARRRTRTPR